MPKRAISKKPKRKARQVTPKGIAVKYEGAGPAFYANFASVSHTPQELLIDFCLVAPPFELDPDTQMIASRISVRVITPLHFGSALVEAINTRLGRAESERSRQSKPK